MEAARAIRLVAVFVVGVVLAMGGAMIYSVAAQMRQQRASLNQSVPQTVASGGPQAASVTETSAPQPETTSSVVRVPIPPPDEPSEAYVQVPQATVVHAPALPPPAAPASKLAINTRPRLSNPAPGLPAEPASFNPASINPSSSGRPSTVQPWTTQPVESTIAANNPPGAVASAPAPQPHTVTLWSGTPLTVKLDQPLSTDQVKEGQYFRATLTVPVVQDGFVIADAGSGVTGEVIEARRAGLFGRAPNLRLVLKQIRATDDQVVPIETISWNDRGRRRNPVAGTVRTFAGAFSQAWVGEEPFVNGLHHNLVLPANTILEFKLAAPVSLTEHLR